MKVLIAQGSESKLYVHDNKVIKDRYPRKYRLKNLDIKLRHFRTNREAKILQKLKTINFASPEIISTDGKKIIKMNFIHGSLLRDVLEKENYVKLCEEIGQKIAILHNNEIIHGDLTTSNMILGDEIYFIDFGLSFFSKKVEDKAVDLHLLKQALESKHYKVWKSCFKCAINSYKKNSNDSSLVLKRLEKVDLRGRNKAKIG